MTKEKYKNVFIRDEQVLINGSTLFVKESFEWQGKDYLLTSDGQYNFHSLYESETFTLVVSNYMSVGEVIKAFVNGDADDIRSLNKAIVAHRLLAEEIRHLSYDPRKERTAPPKALDACKIGDLLQIDCVAPYQQGSFVAVSGEGKKSMGLKVDAHLKLGLHKYLITSDGTFGLFYLFKFTGKRAKELTLISTGCLGIEPSLHELAKLSGTSVDEVRASRHSGIRQSNITETKFKL